MQRNNCYKPIPQNKKKTSPIYFRKPISDDIKYEQRQSKKSNFTDAQRKILVIILNPSSESSSVYENHALFQDWGY